MHASIMRPSVCVCTMLCMLSGCNPFHLVAPDSSDLQTRHIARAGYMAPVHPLYCYETLGDKMCYASPLQTPKDRLVGHYGPEPRHYTPALANASQRVLNDHYSDIPAT